MTDDRLMDARLTDNHGGMTRMRYLSLLLTLAALLLLAACQPNVDPQETQEPETGPTATAPLPAEGEATEESGPQVQASPTPDGYPAAPQPTQALDGYPAAPGAQALPTGYPDDMVVWMIRPLGQQCVDPEEYEYPDLDAAIAALEDAGVEVMDSGTAELGVCESCDCSTSEHFRVQIRALDMERAESLGWMRSR